MAKSPARFNDHGLSRYSHWQRSLVLLASLVSLSVIPHNPYGNRLSAAMMDHLRILEPRPQAEVAQVAEPNGEKYRAVGEYLAQRYRVSPEITTTIVGLAHAIGQEVKVDPLVILAVISVESRFNPIAESTMGAKGLMQVIPRYHPEKFNPLGGEKVAFEPEANIKVGAKILKEYMRRTGDLADALQMYVGATTEENENGYSTKVMTERDRLNHVLRRFQTRSSTGQPRSI